MTKRLCSTPEPKPSEEGLPWWMPADVDNRGVRLTSEMLSLLPKDSYDILMSARAKVQNGQKLRISKQSENKLVPSIIMAIIAAPEYQKELARWALIKPLEIMKFGVQLAPKEVKVDNDTKVQLSIMVPHTATADDWNAVHSARKELSDGDWGIEVGDTPFLGVLEGKVNDDAGSRDGHEQERTP